jgi:hypothetical protein
VCSNLIKEDPRVVWEGMPMDSWDPEFREAVQAMIAEIEGKPRVNFGDYDGGV